MRSLCSIRARQDTRADRGWHRPWYPILYALERWELLFSPVLLGKEMTKTKPRANLHEVFIFFILGLMYYNYGRNIFHIPLNAARTASKEFAILCVLSPTAVGPIKSSVNVTVPPAVRSLVTWLTYVPLTPLKLIP